jgi:hypothetical protein
MDLAVTLVKTVTRAFYTTRDILVIDALILHETYVDAHSCSCTLSDGVLTDNQAAR